MNKADKLRHLNQLLTIVSKMHFDRDLIENFIKEAQFKIAKMKGDSSSYVKEIDVLSNGIYKGGFIADWKEQIETILKKLIFEIEIEEEMHTMNGSIDMHCNKCNHQTKHIVVTQKTEKEIKPELVGTQTLDFWLDTTVQSLKCGSCSEYSLRKYETWSEDFPNYKPINIQILPKRGDESFKQPQSFKNVPEHILNIYQEVIEAFTNEIRLLCAGGLRAVLEAICMNRGIQDGFVDGKKTKSLKGRIYGLCESNILTTNHAEILLHHQYLGDKALHELETPTLEELKIAIEIIAHTLSSIYELEFNGKELGNHIGKRKATNDSRK